MQVRYTELNPLVRAKPQKTLDPTLLMMQRSIISLDPPCWVNNNIFQTPPINSTVCVDLSVLSQSHR